MSLKTRDRPDYIFNDKAQNKKVICTFEGIAHSAFVANSRNFDAAIEFLKTKCGELNEPIITAIQILKIEKHKQK